MEVLQLYQALLSMGSYASIVSIRDVVSAEGHVLNSFRQDRRQVLDPADAYQIHYALQQVMQNGTGASAKQRLPNLVMAGKTGTTNDMRDSWFAGSAGNYVSVVWLGRDDNKPIGLSGGSGALPVWTELMAGLRPVSVVPSQPESITWDWIDTKTGYLSKEGCPNTVYVPLSLKNKPVEVDPCAQGVVPAAVDSFFDSVKGLFSD
jgi:penicillin-binding protein 1B